MPVYLHRLFIVTPVLHCFVFFCEPLLSSLFVFVESSAIFFFYLEKGTGKKRELNQCVFPNKTNGIKDLFGFSVVLSAGDPSLLQMTPHWSLGLCDTKASRWALVSSFLFLSLH